MIKYYSIFIVLFAISSCGTKPVRHSYGSDEIEVSIIPSGEAARVMKVASGPYLGSLRDQGEKARMDVFSKLALEQMESYCGKKKKNAKPDSKPSWFAHTWANEKKLFISKEKDEQAFPQKLEWAFECE
jgi:hypothetical protein